jgi:ricin-type beta-trefoil lectin protein
VLNGIKCKFGVCADIYSYTGVTFGAKDSGTPSNLSFYEVYQKLPLYELKSMIDILYIYMADAGSSARTDLTQAYHHLPALAPLYGGLSGCLETKKAGSGYSVFMDLCNGKSSQQWVYDRAKGTLRNSGSVSDPATGQCLGVTGRVLPLQVIASPCTDPKDKNHKLQQWTYDPETHTLLNGTGTALKFLTGDLSVWADAPGSTPEYLWGAEGVTGTVPPYSDTMRPGEVMHKGESRVSHNNTYELILQIDGNLVFYNKTPKPTLPTVEMPAVIWASNTNGRPVDRVVMGTDGNLAIYPPSTKCRTLPCSLSAPIWQTGTGGHTSSNLRVQDDGTVIIYDKNSKEIWPPSSATFITF